MEKEIKQIKQFRVDLDKILQSVIKSGKSREKSLSITKIEESIMWLGKELARLNAVTPYKESMNPNNSQVEPTADLYKGK